MGTNGQFFSLLYHSSFSATTMRNATNVESSQPDECAEVYPGLWIGSLAGLKAIDNHERKMEMKEKMWVVISLLESGRLVNLSNVLLTSSSALQRSRQEVWELSDTFRGDFLSERLISMLDIIDQATPLSLQGGVSRRDRACLVHCARGISRSAAVCAAWLISRKRMSLEYALETIRSVRPQISPNLGFIASLRALEQCEGDIQQAIQRMKRY
jgi:protein-tyrosine phosphatase